MSESNSAASGLDFLLTGCGTLPENEKTAELAVFGRAC